MKGMATRDKPRTRYYPPVTIKLTTDGDEALLGAEQEEEVLELKDPDVGPRIPAPLCSPLPVSLVEFHSVPRPVPPTSAPPEAVDLQVGRALERVKEALREQRLDLIRKLEEAKNLS